MDLTSKEIEKSKSLLLDLVPMDGAAIGNKAARAQLIDLVEKKIGKKILEDDYWVIRNSLIDEGKITTGKGNGGSILRINVSVPKSPLVVDNVYSRESDLYRPVHDTIIEGWVKNNNIDDFVSEITAFQGKRDTGGPWTRPDISVFAIRAYPYVPGKTIELITFEIKAINNYFIGGVYETASHSAISHRSYLMVHAPKNLDQSTEPSLDRLESEAGRLGVGFITFEDPCNFDTFNVRVEALLQKPDPANLCKFISSQFSQAGKDKIQSRIK